MEDIEEIEDEELKKTVKKLIQVLKAKGWNGDEITELLLQILETE
jgi:DNA-binding transcriptional regulator YhcF (GntR family)